MTTKQYLLQLPKLQMRIKILQEEIETRRTALTSTTAPVLGDRVQTSPGGDKFADMIARLADKEIQLKDMTDIYVEMRDKIVLQILGLDNELYMRILYDRYVKGKLLRTIAKDMCYSYDWVRHAHGYALQSFWTAYKDDIL